MKKVFFAAFLSLSFFLLCTAHASDDNTEIAAKDHAQKGDMHLQKGLPFLAIEEYRKAIDRGLIHPDLFRNLGIALYDLGLIGDAIIELEKSVSLSSDSDLLHMELGILYLAKDQYKKAKEQFFAALNRNPGSANTYYFLGEVFFRIENYKLAWLSAQMAERLGHKGKDLFRKLRDLPRDQELSPWDKNNEGLHIRQILVDSEEKAKDLLERLSEGEQFDDLASTESIALNATLGGYAGHFKPSELHPEIAKVLVERELFSDPVIVQTNEGFHIVQRIAPFDFNFWEEILASSDKYSLEGVKIIEATKQKKRVKFIIHAGSFRKKNVAKKRVKKLQGIGFPSYGIVIENKKTGVWHGVIAGKYNTRKEANESAKKLSQQGYDHFIYQN